MIIRGGAFGISSAVVYAARTFRRTPSIDQRAEVNRGYLPRPRQTTIRYPPRTATAVPNSIAPSCFSGES